MIYHGLYIRGYTSVGADTRFWSSRGTRGEDKAEGVLRANFKFGQATTGMGQQRVTIGF